MLREGFTYKIRGTEATGTILDKSSERPTWRVYFKDPDYGDEIIEVYESTILINLLTGFYEERSAAQ